MTGNPCDDGIITTVNDTCINGECAVRTLLSMGTDGFFFLLHGRLFFFSCTDGFFFLFSLYYNVPDFPLKRSPPPSPSPPLPTPSQGTDPCDGVVCPGSQCQAEGTCVGGRCFAGPVLSDGTSCSDGREDTVDDVCSDGICQGRTTTTTTTTSTTTADPCALSETIGRRTASARGAP